MWSNLEVRTPMLTLCTFGDSILDCGRYNALGLDPGRLLVRNDDRVFPEFRGRDLTTHSAVRLEHRAVDGATVADLPRQSSGLVVEQPAVALLTIGGNDLLSGLIADDGTNVARFAAALDVFLRDLPIQTVLLGNVYDPTFGNDELNFLGVDPALARTNLRRVNSVIADAAARAGALVDLHAHFLGGDPSWYMQVIEPSLRGASEVRRCFLPHLLPTGGAERW